MDQRRIVELFTRLDLFPTFIECVRCGYDDFDAYVANDVKVSVEDARAKFVSCRMLAHLRLAFGVSGPQRMIDAEDHLTYLLVEGHEFDVGIRAKKLNRHFLSYNHRSGRQDKLRQDEAFSGFLKPVAHVILGYRMRRGLEPALTHITLSSEYQDTSKRWQPRWLYPLWNEAEGIPMIRPIQDDLPPEPRVTPKRPPADSADGAGQQGG